MSGENVLGLAWCRKKAGYTQAGFVAAFTREAGQLGIKATVSVRQLRRWENESPPPLPHPGQQAVLEAMFGLPLPDMGFELPVHRRSGNRHIGDHGEMRRRAFVSGTSGIAAGAVLPNPPGGRIGSSDAVALRAQLANLYVVDHRHGAIPALESAGRLERRITHALNNGSPTGTVSRDLHTLLCELACHRAWFGYDGGPPEVARAACTEAVTTAQLVENPLLQIRALNTLALLSASTGRHWEAASAVESAYNLAQRAGAGPTVRLVIALREANAATRAGDLPGARRALSRAVSFQGRTGADADVPLWARFAGPVEIDYATAAYYTRDGHAARAVPFLRSAVAGLGGGYTRNTAWYRARLARTLLAAGEAEEACHEINAVLDVCGGVSSAKLQRRLRAFEHDLASVDAPVTRETAERLGEVTRAAASPSAPASDARA